MTIGARGQGRSAAGGARHPSGTKVPIAVCAHHETCEAAAILTTIRRQHGHGRETPSQCRRSGNCCARHIGRGCAATPAVTALPSRLFPSSFAGAPTRHRTFSAGMCNTRCAADAGRAFNTRRG